MSPLTSLTRLAPLALAFATAPLMAENATPAAPAAPAQLVFQNGRSIPLSSVDIAQDKVLIKTAADGFSAGQSFPLAAVSHVFGDRPAELNQAIALLLFDRHKEAIDLLEPLAGDGGQIAALQQRADQGADRRQGGAHLVGEGFQQGQLTADRFGGEGFGLCFMAAMDKRLQGHAGSDGG